MNDLFSIFLDLMDRLDKNNVEYILIGGMAINIHGFARNTEDIDIFVKPTEKNINNLRNVLLAQFNDEEINEITKEELDKYTVIRFVTEAGFSIDIISRLGETFEFDDLVFELKKIEGVNIRIADVKTLYKLKEKTYREVDQLDLKFLKSKMENK